MSLLALIVLLQCIAVGKSGAAVQDEQIDVVRKDLDNSCKQAQDPKQIFRGSLSAQFTPSDIYNDRRYWLTKKPYNILVADAQSICQRYGGYLAEFDTNEEFSFARNFIIKDFHPTSFSYYIMTGGTDGIKEGQWINRYGLNSLTAPNWGSGEPNNKANDENCQCFSKHHDWRMNDCNCNFFINAADITGFLCEIPE
ncbi:hypothetical protein Btru_066531 [Bulinus truncatus]|nr:hypothetical protein Btru_066531 [Bulinus truncatus]